MKNSSNLIKYAFLGITKPQFVAKSVAKIPRGGTKRVFKCHICTRSPYSDRSLFVDSVIFLCVNGYVSLLHFFLAWLFLPKKEVCYPVYGCFKRHPNGLVNLPQSPSRIGIRFNLFTRANRNSAKLIDDHHQYKLTTSHFKISRRTIFVIHGFTGKGRSL